jgi:hypothetical protein
MSGENVLDYLVAAAVIMGSVWLLMRFVRRNFKDGLSSGCSGCTEKKDCQGL